MHSKIPKYAAILLLIVILLSVQAESSDIPILPAGTTDETPCTLYVSPPDTLVFIDTEFWMDVVINESVMDLMGYDIVITFDNSLLEVKNVVEGSLPSGSGHQTFFYYWGNGGTEIHATGSIMGNTIDGPGALFSIKFKAVSVGTASLGVSYSELRDDANVSIAHETAGANVEIDIRIGVEKSTWGRLKMLYR
jgi:hypothetical protein